MKKNIPPTSNIEHENRKETRYSCVAIPLLYSAITDTHIKGLGKKLYHASAVDMNLSGLAFDVEQPLLSGDKILVLIDKPQDFIQEELMTEVRWCKELASGKYRVGVEIDGSPKSMQKNVIPEINFNAERTPPVEVKTLCPACKKYSNFIFVAYQPVLAGKGIMPLYDCSECGTTRTLTSIIDFNSKE